MKIKVDGQEIEVPRDMIARWESMLIVTMHDGRQVIVDESHSSFTERYHGTSLSDLKSGEFGIIIRGPDSWLGEKVMRLCSGFVFLKNGTRVGGYLRTLRIEVMDKMELERCISE